MGLMPAALAQEFLDRINKIYRILLGLLLLFSTAKKDGMRERRLGLIIRI
jgi:hypothetical protein